ncbi:MAG TPA: flagellar hook-basal body complex protein [Novosphingobium sp.]
MLGAIYVGLSGLTAYSSGLKTISNNVGNLNSTGFKATNVTFTDLFSHGNTGLAFSEGTDSENSGNGVRVGKASIDFSQGDLRASNGDLDLGINGSGFFVLLNGEKTFYTRTGQFEVDKDGFISQQNTENRLGMLDAAGRVVPYNIAGKRTSAPDVTKTITFADNLSSTATEHTISDIAIYDSRGGKQVWTIKFTKSTAQSSNNEWTVTVTNSTQRTVAEKTLKFIGNVIDPSSAKMVIEAQPAGANPLSVTLDFSGGVTSFSGGTTSTLRASKVDGHGVGQLTTVTVNEDGKVKLSYSNGQTETDAQVALADFRDPQELEKAGDGLFAFHGKGERRILASGVDGVGKIVSKQIEASNVDLSAQFGDLILIQRGFQASSQVVSVANDMIQQLFGIRGQG